MCCRSLAANRYLLLIVVDCWFSLADGCLSPTGSWMLRADFWLMVVGCCFLVFSSVGLVVSY